ncbi:Keratin, type II cytoskeletal 8 [Plecturocebus cupreus]
MYTEMESEFLLIKKDVDEAYMNKGLTGEINFLRQLCEEEIFELQHQISDTFVVLSMDNSSSLDVNRIISKSALSSRDGQPQPGEAESLHQIKCEELWMLAGEHQDDLSHSKVISEKN